MSTPTQWDYERKHSALKLTSKGREILENSTKHRIDKNTILLKKKKQ